MTPARRTPVRSIRSCLAFAAVLVTTGGCANYRYDFTPAAGPTTAPGFDAMPSEVVSDRDLVVPAPPARLRLRQYESRCVLLIENPTDREITLDGPASAIVDPVGQTRALATQLIPPGAFTKLILPPLRDYAPVGPTIGFGFGVLADAGRPDTPRPAAMLDVGRAQDYWEWDGEGRIRIVLGLKQGDSFTKHAYLLQRTRR